MSRRCCPEASRPQGWLQTNLGASDCREQAPVCKQQGVHTSLQAALEDLHGAQEAPGGAASAKRRSRSSASGKKRGSAADKDSRVDGTPQSFAQLLSEATPLPAQAPLSPCALVLGR